MKSENAGVSKTDKEGPFHGDVDAKQYRAPQDIQKLAAELNYREDLIRIPILCHLQSASDQEAFLHSIKNGREHLTQDISFQMEDRYI